MTERFVISELHPEPQLLCVEVKDMHQNKSHNKS